jgi:hypothetical protein
LVRDHLDIGFLDHQLAILYEQPNKCKESSLTPYPRANKR